MPKTHFPTPAGSGYEWAYALSQYFLNLPLVTGNVYWVSSGTGTDSAGYGYSPEAPLASLDYAVGLCTAHNGDVIILMESHAETYNATTLLITLDVAGIRVIGQGRGTKRATFTSATSTAAVVTFGAANVSIENCLFVCGIDSQVICLDVNSTDAVIKDCEFRNATAAQMITAIDINGGGANACDRTTVDGCVFRMSAVGSARAIELGEVADAVVIRNCTVWGDFDDACIHNPTGKVLTNLLIRDCMLTNLQTGDHSIELVSACTGNLVANYYHNDMTQQTGVDPGSCFSFQCFQDDVIDTSAIITPVVT